LATAGWGLAIPLFAACGPTPQSPTAPAAGPAKPGEVTPAPAATAAPTAQAAVTKIAYGLVAYAPFHIVTIVGVEKPEFMRKHGLEIDLLITGSSPASIQAIVGGSLQMTTATGESAWAAQDKSPGLSQIAVISNGYPYSLIVNPEIKKVDDLRGKPVGATAVRGGADTAALRLILYQNGLKDGDYSIVPVGALAERTAAMKAGTVMGVVQIEPQTSFMLDQGFVELDNADNYPELRDLQSIMLISRKDWYEPNMTTAVAFMKGWLEITKWVYDPGNRDEIVALLVKAMKTEAKYASNAYERFVVKSKTVAQDPRVDLQAMARMADLQKKIGGLETVPTDFAEYADNVVVDKAMTS